jgi:hypothetical protein
VGVWLIRVVGLICFTNLFLADKTEVTTTKDLLINKAAGRKHDLGVYRMP